jgi:hypothetical protein
LSGFEGLDESGAAGTAGVATTVWRFEHGRLGFQLSVIGAKENSRSSWWGRGEL